MEDEEVVFEGSALHEHLKSLNLIDANEDYPSLTSQGACASQLSQFEHLSKTSTLECPKKSWWQQIKFGLCVTSTQFKKIKKKFLLIDQLEKEMLSYMALLVCSKGLLTPDDRLHLYYFSPIFNNLVEEPALVNIISEQESKVISTLQPPTSVKGLMAAAGAVIAVPFALLCGGSGSALNKAVENFKDLSCQVAAATSVIWTPLLALLLTYKIARTLTRRRYTRAYKRAKEALLCLASLQSSCLPVAFSAAADAALLMSPSASSDTALHRRVGGELAHLHRLLQDTLRCATAATAPSGSVHPAQMEDDWTQTKALRRDLELQVSALARDVLMKAERSSTRERLPNSTSWTSVSAGGGDNGVGGAPVLHVMEILYRSLAEALPDIQTLAHAITCQVGLLRHCWLYSEENQKPRLQRASEEVSSAASLMRRMQACLLVLDQMIPNLKEFSSLVPPDSSEALEGEFREIVDRKYGDIQLKVSNLFDEWKLCQQDLEVLTESLATRRLRLLKEPGVNSRRNAEVALRANVVNNSEQPSTTPELHIIPLTPYIAEDEFFEATTEDGGDSMEVTTKWDAESEQDEHMRRQVIACNKRVLSELQPILVRKKEEFRQREERAKKRVRHGHGSDACIVGETGEEMIPATSNEDGIIDDIILNVVDASSALGAAEHASYSNPADFSCSIQSRPSNSTENSLRQTQNSISSSQFQNSSDESQFEPEDSADGYQASKNADTCSVVGSKTSGSEDQLTLTECSELPPVRVGLCGLSMKLPHSCCRDQGFEMNPCVSKDKSCDGPPDEKLRSSAILNSDVHDQNLYSDGNLYDDGSPSRNYDSINCHESLDYDKQLESKKTIFETAGNDSEVRVPQTPDHVVRDEEFESLPDQGDDDGESKWNIRARPRDLKERLRLMMESQRRDLGNSDQVSDGHLDFQRSSQDCGWGFPSQLAAEAVRLSSKFGVGEETFGGMGEGEEETFGGMGEGEEETFRGMGEGEEETFGSMGEGEEERFGGMEKWDSRKFEELAKEETMSGEEQEDKRYSQCDGNNDVIGDTVDRTRAAYNQAVGRKLDNDVVGSRAEDEKVGKILQLDDL